MLTVHGELVWEHHEHYNKKALKFRLVLLYQFIVRGSCYFAGLLLR